MKFSKYHALGNDYIVITPEEFGAGPDLEVVRRICHRNYGVGSDGILLGPLPSSGCDFKLRIFNPDGSEAEKSGNGLRIFARYLFDMGHVRDGEFRVETLGGDVSCRVLESGSSVRVEMGKVSFDSALIPVAGEQREVLNEEMEVGGESLTFCAATVGNPHCVVTSGAATAERAHQLGPMIENHPKFPNRTNVQFLKVLDRNSIQIEIWERGAGYTLASGSSSTAAAAVACRLGLCDPEIAVHMPGGVIHIQLGEAFTATMTGPVTKICDGVIASDL